MSNRLRVVFMGTAEFAAPALAAIAKVYDVVCVYTRPPKPAGRGYALSSSPVHQLAEELGLPVRTPKTLRNNPDEIAFLKSLHADIGVVAAYGLILPGDVLTLFPKGCMNIHGSLLPKWRGAAPIERSLMAGDAETGITIIQMDAGVDTGDMLLTQSLKIKEEDTSETLRRKLSIIGADLILRALRGDYTPEKQPTDGATYAPKIEKAEGLLDFSFSASDLQRRIRAIPCYFERDGERISVLSALALFDTPDTDFPAGHVLSDKKQLLIQTGNGILRLVQLQRPGKRVMSDADFLNGYKLTVGKAL